MEEKQYDNTNRGALWPCRGFSGSVDIEGATYYVTMAATKSNKQDSKAPVYMAVVRNSSHEEIVAIYRPDKPEAKHAGHGSFGDFMLFVHINQSDNESAPALRLSVARKQQQPKPPAMPPEDDLPF